MLFAFGIAIMVARVKRGAGFFRTIFYLPALAPPVAATLGFVYILNPANGPVNMILGKLGIQGPLWFQSPGWSKPSLVLLGIWGIGNMFDDLPRGRPRRAASTSTSRPSWTAPAPLQRLRYVTLPTISPVILFAVVIGVIAALQYFTQAYVAANIASGQASQAGDVSTVNARLPAGLDALLSDPALQRRLPLLQHGLRLGDGDAAVRRRLRGDVIILVNSRRWVHYRGAVR